MTQPPDPSPRAQAILRAIENEAQARRERAEGERVRGSYKPPTAPLPPSLPAEPLGEAADRLMRLVDHVVAQTEGVRARVREVEESLDILSSKLSETATIKLATEEPEEGPAPVAVAEPDPEPEPEPEPVPEPVVIIDPPAPAPIVPDPAPEPAASTPVADESDGARLMAIEMAVSGSSRGEVGSRLTEDFHVADPAPILDDVFGAGSPDSTRMPWTN
jgi:hypothetical protein